LGGGETDSMRERAPALVLVAAVADNGVIGQRGRLPWRLKSDLRYFRTVTMGKPIVMGRKTYQAIGKPLGGRTNIVVSRNADFTAPGVVATASIARALAVARADALRRRCGAIAVIGGADLYAETIGCADRLVITQVHLAPPGDVAFPAIDRALWREVERSEHTPRDGDEAPYSRLVYERSATHLQQDAGGQ
ncbi:MAG: dihydrofolate reductase, partial [Acetobacteraceae bacterium]|nr:dihydrofolate reductase [Acetobacteraceae bacterium]